MVRGAYGLDSPPVGRRELDLRAHERSTSWSTSSSWLDLGGALTREEIFGALERATVGSPAATSPAGSRSPISSAPHAPHGSRLPARARGRKLPPTAGLAVPRRRGAALDRRALGRSRLARPDSVSRERFFFYAACTRPSRRLYLVREASPTRAPPRAEPVLGRGARPVRRGRRRPLDQAPAAGGARPGGWTGADRPGAAARAGGLAAPARRGRRARPGERVGAAARRARAPSRGRRSSATRRCSTSCARTTFSVTELEVFADCSSIWFLERVIGPRTIDGEIDARVRGSVAHQALFKFFSGLPKRVGADRVDAARLDERLASCASASPRRSTAGSGSSSAGSSAASSRRASGATWSISCARRPSRSSCSSRAASRSPSAPSARRRSCSAGSSRRLLGRGKDRPDRRRAVQRAGDRPGLQVGEDRALGGEDRVGAAAPDPALHARPARPRRHRAARRPLPRARGRTARAGATAGRGRGRRARLQQAGLPRRGRVLGADRAREGARRPLRRADPRRRHPARPEGRLPVPDLVRPLSMCRVASS